MRCAAFVLLAAALPAFADSYPRQPGIDVEHYTFHLWLSDESDEIRGETTVAVRIRSAGVKELVLDLASPANGKGMTVDSGSAPHRHDADRLHLALTDNPAVGERREFMVKYHGVPGSGLRIGLNKYKERTFFGLSWPNLAHQWLPTVDHPYDKATSEFIVTAPARYQVAANGLLVETRDLGDGYRLTHWKQSVPIASWLNTIAAAQFSVHHAGLVRGVPLQTWVYYQDAALGAATFEPAARRAIEFFSDRLGPYPYEKLANIEAAGLNGGTEHASAILYGEDFVGGKRQSPTLVAHEIAHQWFGDSVTESDWDDVWLSEGFATYCALLYTEHYEGRDAFVAGLRRAQQTVAATEKKMPDQPIVHRNLANPANVLNSLVYQKAGWVLHMLRGLVGTEKFWAGLRAYYARYRDGHATTELFRQTMEEQSGMPLSWFFDQWLHKPGTPVLTGHWGYDAAAGKLIVELEQTQRGEVFRLPLELAIDSRLEKLEMTARRQRFDIAIEKPPTRIALDPNVWILMDSQGVTGQ